MSFLPVLIDLVFALVIASLIFQATSEEMLKLKRN